MMKNNNSQILNGSIFKNLLLYTIPIILTGVFQLFYNAADIIVVGRYAGSDSLAAVGSTSSITHLYINLFIGLSGGTSVCVAQFVGGREKENLEKTVHTSMAIALIGGMVLMIIGVFFAGYVLALMKTPENIIAEATLYMRIIFIGIPVNLIYNFGAAILRAEGDTKSPLVYLTVSGIINVVLNLIFVIVFKMKAEGVGLATIVSQFISAFLVVRHLVRTNSDCKLRLKNIRIYKNILMRILKIGVPAGIQGMIFSISNVLIQSSINSFGSIVVAGNSAASNLEGFSYTAMNSMYQSVVTFVGQHMGAKKFSRIKEIIKTGCLQVILIGVIFSGFLLLFAHPLLNLYAPGDEAVIASGIERFKVILTTYFICGIMEVAVGGSRGMGESFKPMIVSIIGVCGIRIVWVYTIFEIFRTPFSVYISYPVSWLVTGGLQLIICMRVLKKQLKNCS